jgi:hypothetical protein
VTNLYVRDSLLIDMTADENTVQGAGSTRTDQTGMVFIVIGQGVRKCLVCEELFTRRASAEHAATPCYPRTEESRTGRSARPQRP